MRLTALVLLSLILAAPFSRADTPIADSLASRGRLGIPIERARLLESELGQLLIVNVDGFGSTIGSLALEPDFAPLLERLQIGGVIPHYGSTDYQKIRRTNRALSAMTTLPLLICCDIVRLRSSARSNSPSAAFGDGYVGGFIGRYRALPDRQFRTLAGLNAFVFAALGMNVALGPTVDDSTHDPETASRAREVIEELSRFGLQPVLKHFPFLPEGANLHHSSPDTKVPLEVAQQRFSVFHDLAGFSGILMTTHVNDSRVDSSIVTFSPTWLGVLRRDTGYSGLLMSDGLLMLKNYADRSQAGPDPIAAWAVRAILAGHDFVILEGSAGQTIRVFNGVLREACEGTRTGNELARRIEESYDRIRLFKARNESLLSRQIDVPGSTIDEIISVTPRDGADLRAFRFPAGLPRDLAPRLADAAGCGEP